MTADPEVRSGRRHCGSVRFKVMLADGLASIRRCTCSFCRMRGAVVAMATAGGLETLREMLDVGEVELASG